MTLVKSSHSGLVAYTPVLFHTIPWMFGLRQKKRRGERKKEKDKELVEENRVEKKGQMVGCPMRKR